MLAVLFGLRARDSTVMAARPLSWSLRGDRDIAFHVRVIAAIIFDLARFFDDSLAGLVRAQLHIPVAVPGGSGVGDEIIVHPLDRVSDAGGNRRRSEGK